MQSLNLSHTPSPSPSHEISASTSKKTEKKSKDKNSENVDPDGKEKKQGVKRKAASMKEEKSTPIEKEPSKARRRTSINPALVDGKASVKRSTPAGGFKEIAPPPNRGGPLFKKDPNFQYIQVDFSDEEFNSRL